MVSHPVLTLEQLEAVKTTEYRGWKARTIDITFPTGTGPQGLQVCRCVSIRVSGSVYVYEWGRKKTGTVQHPPSIPSICPFSHAPSHPLTHSLIHPLVQPTSIRGASHSPTHSSVRPCIRLSCITCTVHLTTHATHPPHPSIHPFIHPKTTGGAGWHLRAGGRVPADDLRGGRGRSRGGVVPAPDPLRPARGAGPPAHPQSAGGGGGPPALAQDAAAAPGGVVCGVRGCAGGMWCKEVEGGWMGG